MPGNLISFESGEAIAKVTRVAATGILRPIQVELGKGTTLFRLHDGARPLGPWWFTGFEYQRVANLLQLDPGALLAGRDQGLSALAHAFRLLPEWYMHRSDQLLRFGCITLRSDLVAFHGEGRNAPRLGGRGPARQVFIPDLQFFKDAFTPVTLQGLSDAELWQYVKRYGSARLPFE